MKNLIKPNEGQRIYLSIDNQPVEKFIIIDFLENKNVEIRSFETGECYQLSLLPEEQKHITKFLIL